MDHDELMRLRGEQATLEKERSVIRSQISAERMAIYGFTNLLVGPWHNLPRDWLDIEIARLRRIHELVQRGEEIDRKTKDLKAITGL